MTKQWQTIATSRKPGNYKKKEAPLCEWQVSNHGEVRIFNTVTGQYKPASTSLTGGHPGSQYYALSVNHLPEKYVHRLVAYAFIPNPENKRTIDHIDGDKLNNHVSNLRWATHAENQLYYRQLKQKREEEYNK